MVNDLVSVITPCYGTAKYLPQLLRSILNQTYPSIEVFVIDDGSPDDIKSVVDQFAQPYQDKGYKLEYVYQTNSGQSVAVQNGLDRINGEYLVWPDSDDYYSSDEAIAKMVKRFKDSPSDVGMVRTQQVEVRDDDHHTQIKILGAAAKTLEDSSLFVDCLLNKNGFYFCPGAYMVKTEALKSSTKFPIYTEKDAGQNWQLMLPVLYSYRCSTILEPLYNIVKRTTSHSRSRKTYEQSKQRIKTYQNTIYGTLNRIANMSDKKLAAYKEMVNSEYLNIYFSNALNYGDKSDSKELLKQLKAKNQPIAKATQLKYCLLRIGLLKFVQKLYQ